MATRRRRPSPQQRPAAQRRQHRPVRLSHQGGAVPKAPSLVGGGQPAKTQKGKPAPQGGGGGGGGGGGTSGGGGREGGRTTTTEKKPTPKEIAKGVRQERKESLVGELLQAQEELRGRPPGRKFIQKALRQNPRRIAKRLGRLEERLEAQAEREGLTEEVLGRFHSDIINLYEDIYGVPPPESFVKSLLKMGETEMTALIQQLTAQEEAQTAKEEAEEEKKAKAAAITREYESALFSVYFDVWGVPPPPGYVEQAVAAGMNVFEFEQQERNKPAYANSPQYQSGFSGLAAQISEALGMG